jgi:nitroreductase
MIDKTAVTSVPIHPLLAGRWSPRAFADKPVEREKLLALLEAVRWAASSRNEQPWRLIVAQRHSDADGFQKLLACLSPTNIEWADRAPILIAMVAKMAFDEGSPNAHAFHDCGFATASLTTQAMACDLWVHQMAGFNPGAVRELYKIPQGFDPVTVLAIGYRGDADVLPERRKQQELGGRSRKTLGEIAFSGGWERAVEVES